jgi:hypothetical protein
MPDEFQFAFRYMNEGRVGLAENDYLAVFGDLLRAKSNALFVEGARPRLAAVKKNMDDLVRKNPGDHRVLLGSEVLNKLFRNEVEGLNFAGEGLSRYANEFTRAIRNLGFNVGDFSPQDMQRIMTKASVFFAGSAMSMRPALAIRNFFQSTLPGLQVGYLNNFAAMKDVASNPGRILKEASEAGVIRERDAIFLAGEVGKLSPGLSPSGFVDLLLEAQRFGLIPFRAMDTWNRLVSFQSARRSIRKHAKVLERGDIDGFLLKTGLAGNSDVVQKQIVNLIASGDVEGAARQYGKQLADDTQFVYSRINSPLAFQGVGGRLLGQFGTWPIGYIEYISRNVGMGNLGNNLNSTLRRRHTRAFVARWMGMIAAISGAGAALGIDTSSYNFANPLAFEGGPYFQALKNMPEALLGQDEFRRDQAQAQLRRFVKTAYLPFQGVVTDIDQALDEKDNAKALSLLLGFNRRRQRGN